MLFSVWCHQQLTLLQRSDYPPLHYQPTLKPGCLVSGAWENANLSVRCAPRFQLHHLSLPVAAQQGLFHTQPQHSRRPQERNPSSFWRGPLCFMYQRRMTLKIEFLENSWPLCICDTMLRCYLRSVSMVEAKQRKNGNIDITYTVSFQKELKAELFQKVCWDSL